MFLRDQDSRCSCPGKNNYQEAKKYDVSHRGETSQVVSRQLTPRKRHIAAHPTVTEAPLSRTFIQHIRSKTLSYNFAKRLKTLRGLIRYEHICDATQPNRFRLNPLHHTVGQTSTSGPNWTTSKFPSQKERISNRIADKSRDSGSSSMRSGPLNMWSRTGQPHGALICFWRSLRLIFRIFR